MKTNPGPISDNQLLCPVCSSKCAKETAFDDINLYRCPGCDHCFTDQTQLRKFEEYSDKYYEDSHKNWNLHPTLKYFERLYRTIQASGPQRKIVDIGCGKGEFLKYLHARQPQYELIGVDMSFNPPTEGITFLKGDFLTIDLKHDFDVVVSLAAIEHMSDIQTFVERLSRLCRPKGVVIVMTLDDRSVMYEAARFLFKIGIQAPFRRLYSRHHLHHFNSSSLKKLMEQHHLTLIEQIRHNIPLATIDMPAVSAVKRFVFFIGVVGSFLLGKLTGRTYLQTLVCNKQTSPAEIGAIHNGLKRP